MSAGKRSAIPRRAIWLVACLLLMLSSPLQAHATFKDGPDSYPATQDLGTYGARIDADDLPDGTYKVGARTSSRMCILYTNPDDAESRESKEQAIVTVEGDSMVAVFYISKAYTHLYFGTEEQARAQTDEKGEDASAYIAGDPDEGYVPHLFAIPIPALNTPITIATYSGGEQGVREGRVVHAHRRVHHDRIRAPQGRWGGRAAIELLYEKQ